MLLAVMAVALRFKQNIISCVYTYVQLNVLFISFTSNMTYGGSFCTYNVMALLLLEFVLDKVFGVKDEKGQMKCTGYRR